MTHIKTTSIRVSHRTKSNLSYISDLEVKLLTANERLKNGLKYFGLSLSASFLFVFIPILHFVLVPGSLLIGCYLLYRQMNLKYFRLEKTISCPECKNELRLKPMPFNGPMNEICDHCRAQILIEDA